MASHAGVRIDEVKKALLERESGCAPFHTGLEDCLAESGRDWRACQAHVQALKRCTARVRAEKATAAASPSTPTATR
jgi:hypothetical protein